MCWKRFLFWKLPESQNPPPYEGGDVAMEGYHETRRKVDELHMRLATSPEPWSADFDRREAPRSWLLHGPHRQ